jgi:NADH-quinone oxidoreductase E subunit
MLSDQARERMRAIAAQYPSARSAMLPALHIAQDEEGYVTPEGMTAVAEALGVRPDEVDSVVSFYSMFRKKPVGRHVIKVCTSIACYLRGCDPLLAHLEERLGVRPGETTPDGLFTLQTIECVASCGTAPVLQVNEAFVENVTLDRADALIDGLRHPPGVDAHDGASGRAPNAPPPRRPPTAPTTHLPSPVREG